MKTPEQETEEIRLICGDVLDALAERRADGPTAISALLGVVEVLAQQMGARGAEVLAGALLVACDDDAAAAHQEIDTAKGLVVAGDLAAEHFAAQTPTRTWS